MVPFCSAAEVIPPAPQNHFNDYAHVVSTDAAQRLNAQLEDFERQTSNQIVVAIFPKMQSDSSIEDYTVRVMNAWKVGLKGKNNGAVLFVFVQDHKLFINTGYGLEGALPDATCKQIIDQEITPQFKQNNFEAGLTAGVNAMMAAVRGEYKGTGRTVRDDSRGPGGMGGVTGGLCSSLLPIAIILIIIYLNRSTVYGPRGRSRGWYWGPGYYGGFGGFGGWGSGGGSSGGSWGGGGGGGSFMSGGGSSGGGAREEAGDPSMKPNDFINQLADDEIVAAIKQAEGKTSGEIRVFITHKKVGDPILAAGRHFERLKMNRAKLRNAVLIFVAPASHKFAVIGDSGIHSHCGDVFWNDIAMKMTQHFQQAAWTEGITHAIQRAGELLAEHFPRSANDVNELPDRVEHD